LQDEVEITHLRGDAIMYCLIYADLVMLSKSSDLGKSTLDMNKHYLELSVFLNEMITDAEIALEKNKEVFLSETKLFK